jgi:hypothetical protein
MEEEVSFHITCTYTHFPAQYGAGNVGRPASVHSIMDVAAKVLSRKWWEIECTISFQLSEMEEFVLGIYLYLDMDIYKFFFGGRKYISMQCCMKFSVPVHQENYIF